MSTLIHSRQTKFQISYNFSLLPSSISHSFTTMSSTYSVIQPFHIIMKLMGFTLFTIDAKFKAKFKIFDWICLALAVCSVALINYFYWTAYVVIILPRPTVVNASVPYINLCQNFISIAIIIGSFVKRNEICQIFEKFNEIDEQLRVNFDVKFDYKSQKCKLIRWTIATFSAPGFIVILRVISGYRKQNRIGRKEDVLFYWYLSSAFIIMMSFKLVACAVKMRYETINECLR